MLTEILSDFHEDSVKHPCERPEKFEASLAAPEGHVSLLKSMRVFMDAWPAQPVGTDVLRVSGLYDLCPREFVLNYWQPRDSRAFDWKSQFMVYTGSALHEYIQNQVLGPMGVLYGKWIQREPDDFYKIIGFHPDPEKAVWEIQQQKPMTWRYEEYRLWHNHWRIAGHVDGKVCENRVRWISENQKLFDENPLSAIKRLETDCPAKDKQLILFELKTTGTFTFDKLLLPEDIADYYKMQASVYQALSKTWKTLFWYMKRDDFSSKAFIYDYEKRWYDEAKRKARIVWESIRDEKLPESGMKCKLPSDKRAKECVHGGPCWLTERKLNWPEYVEAGKMTAAASGRKLLDLSEWVADPKEEPIDFPVIES